MDKKDLGILEQATYDLGLLKKKVEDLGQEIERMEGDWATELDRRLKRFDELAGQIEGLGDA